MIWLLSHHSRKRSELSSCVTVVVVISLALFDQSSSEDTNSSNKNCICDLDPLAAARALTTPSMSLVRAALKKRMYCAWFARFPVVVASLPLSSTSPTDAASLPPLLLRSAPAALLPLAMPKASSSASLPPLLLRSAPEALPPLAPPKASREGAGSPFSASVFSPSLSASCVGPASRGGWCS